jgi:hypothetical protein
MKTFLHAKTTPVSVIFKKHFKPFHLFLFFLFFLFSSWLMFHTFSYNGKTREIQIAYKLWSDFGAHIPLIRSFSQGDNFFRITHGVAPEYPIFPGEPIRYHFVFYMFVGLLEKMGLRIDWALNVLSIGGFFTLLVALYILAYTLTHSKAVALLTIIFFLFNGSLGFIRFFTLHPLSPDVIKDIIHAKDFPAFAPWGPGEITAFWNLNIYTNQRHLAGAFALVILFILTCLHIEPKTIKKQLPWALLWGLIFGSLPYFHQPTLLIVAVIMATYIALWSRLRIFLLICGLITTALVIPQLLGMRGSSSPLEWYPGYTIHNELMAQKDIIPIIKHMLSFWWQNLGLHSILILVGFCIVPKRMKLLFLPLFPLFIIPNLFKFSIEASANHKFFNFTLMLGGILSSYVIVSIWEKVRKQKKIVLTILVTYLSACTILAMTLTGIIDFFVVANDTKGKVQDIPSNEIASWILTNTPPNSVFLNSSYLYHPASLAGRFIFLGWPYFAWSAGYKENRMPIMDTMYESREAFATCSLFKKYAISHITVEDVRNDTNLPTIDLSYYLKTYTPVFVSRDKRYAIFTTQSICPP